MRRGIVAVNLCQPHQSPRAIEAQASDRKNLETTRSRPRPKSENLESASKLDDDAGPFCVRMTRHVRNGQDPKGARQVVLHCASGKTLKFLGDDAQMAFQCGDVSNLPSSCPLKHFLDSVSNDPAKRQQGIDHLNDEPEIPFELVPLASSGARKGDKVLYREIDRGSLVMRTDFESKPYIGQMLPAIGVFIRDVHHMGLVVALGPWYRWANQQWHQIPEPIQRSYFYDQPLGDDDSLTMGQVFNVVDCSVSGSSKYPLQIITGSNGKLEAGQVVLCGKNKDIPVGVSMGISFLIRDQIEPGSFAAGSLEDLLTRNPWMATSHGIVERVLGDPSDREGQSLMVLWCLERGNFPFFLQQNRMHRAALVSTNQRVQLKLNAVGSAFPVVSVTLSSCPEEIPENARHLGTPGLFSNEAFVSAHMEFDRGAWATDQAAGPAAKSDQQPPSHFSGNKALAALAVFADYCACASPPQEFREHWAWFKEYTEKRSAEYGGRFCPSAKFGPVEPLPANQVLNIMKARAQMFGPPPSYGPQIASLRNALGRVVELKARRTKTRPGKLIVDLSISGLILFEILAENVSSGSMSTRFEEGAVVVTLNDIRDAAMLWGEASANGLFTLGGAGFVQLSGPVEFWYNLYSRTSAQDVPPFGGSAQMTFHKYVSKDRHGGELTGALLHEDDDTGAGGGGAEEAKKAAVPAPAQTATQVFMNNALPRLWQ